ncbi:hypothetical protein NEOLEDRAFT_1109333 [Neolentinus lepideus HHB14362 ss-1]|uniref:F-box domain-containing protein n=1 Tax=Neolentinus lepideus HHB14362 ss-1 TaxID=1314782 RepID=A0A165UCV9_9AGAM|nr:hypothetical protein NEOLEDRAFT_1109333 [Neolentinus lepideus HHB14362 ss-1]
MSKRPLSPAPLPAFKCRHTSFSSQPHTTLPLNFDSALYDEVILQIFSHLPFTDLCAIQRTNRNWARLALDNQVHTRLTALWKALYLAEYGRTRLRGGRGFVGRADGREIKALPGRAKEKAHAQEDAVKDWKWMFRISSNWRRGRCSIEQLDESIERPFRTSLLSTSTAGGPLRGMHVILAGNLTITVSSLLSTSPSINVLSSTQQSATLVAGSSQSTNPAYVTTLALDQSPPISSSPQISRLACFLSSGEFSIFRLHHSTPSSSSKLFTYIPTRPHARTSPIIQAVYHHPLLITLSQSFHLSLYDLSAEGKVRLTQTLTSFTSYPPSSLVLSAPAPSAYKLVLAYAIHVYPAHWSVGATELIISAAEGMAVTSTRTARAVDVPGGWVDAAKLQTMRAQWARKVASVADTQTDGKWVVLAPGEAGVCAASDDSDSAALYRSSSLYSGSTLQLYRLHLPSAAHASAAPKLTFVRSLHGQVGPVSALALADGRCVSLGVNGSIWAWDLEAGTGAEVAEGVDVLGDEGRMTVGARGAVAFDERRIVSAGVEGVQVRRFDI